MVASGLIKYNNSLGPLESTQTPNRFIMISSAVFYDTVRRCANAVYCHPVSVCVCVSVCHTPVLYQNGESYDDTNSATRYP